MLTDERKVQFDSGSLRLEGMLRPVVDASFSAIVLHPHPLYGGDMDNHVVTTLCDAFNALGANTLRFNFRGAGGSEGRYDDGRGERQDALGGVRFLREFAPDVPVVLAGYSFGAIVAVSIAAEVAPKALVIVSPPMTFATIPAPPKDLRALAVTGTSDQVAPPAAVESLAGAGYTIALVDGADHSWWGHTHELSARVSSFLMASALSGR